MAKRIIIISSGPLFIALVIFAFVFVGIGHGQPVSIETARAQIITLAGEGKLTEIAPAIDKFITDFAGDGELHANLLVIADSLTWRRVNTEADRIYRHILDNETDQSLTSKAQVGLARLDVLKLISEKKFSAAIEQANYLVSDFRNEPDCAIALFQIGQEFGWQRRYVESKNAFDGIIETFPTTALAQEVKLWSIRANICSLIIGKKARSTSSGQAKDEEIIAAIDKLISDFEGDSRLADTLFWIGREYEWTRGTTEDRTEWYNAPNSIYERLTSQFKYGQAEWDYKRLSHRMKIFNLLKDADLNAVNTAIEEMVNEFAGRPELPGELYWLACGYEESNNNCTLAEQMYERIVKEFPDSAEANNAVLDIRRLDIWKKLNEGDINESQVMIDNFIADFNQHTYASACLNVIAYKYYMEGMATLEKKFLPEENRMIKSSLGVGKYGEANNYFNIAVNIWDKMINQIPYCPKTTEACYFTAVCYNVYLKEYEKAIAFYQKVLDEWPDYEHAWHAQYSIGECYEKLLEKGILSRSEAMPKIIGAYKTVVEKYPNCRKTKDALLKLDTLGYQNN